MKLTLVKLAAITALVVSASGAGAQTPVIDRSQMMDACRADYVQHCTFVMPGGGRVMACLSDVIDQISPDCAALVSAATSCAPDVEEFCADVEPGDGRMQACLLAHREHLSGPCAATMATKAKAR